MPVALVNCGRIAASSPELSTELVEASRIVCASRAGTGAAPGRTEAATASQTASISRVRNGPSLWRAAGQREGGGADQDRQPDQHETETERQRQIALAGFEHDRCRHRARVAGDVAADHDDRA